MMWLPPRSLLQPFFPCLAQFSTTADEILRRGLNSLGAHGHHERLETEWQVCAMQCLACGAEMQLREVVLADIPTMPGFERHTFRCSACPQVARRLVICRAKMPVVDPLVPSAAPEAPTTNLQTGQQAAGSVLPNAVEKLHSTQAALEDQDVTDCLPTVEKLSMALKERAVAARASAWAKTVEKLRNTQMALKERAATAGTNAPAGEFNRT
jgi:hypothetical protein